MEVEWSDSSSPSSIIMESNLSEWNDNFLDSIRYGSNDESKLLIYNENDFVAQETDENFNYEMINCGNQSENSEENNINTPEDDEIDEDDISQEQQFVVIDDVNDMFFETKHFDTKCFNKFDSTNNKGTLKIIRSKNNSFILTTAEIEDSSSASSSSDKVEEELPQQQSQELKLSEEEKRLLSKEGITLPGHYPLTKFEERELKRIRRKIRNKISAQDSRKRKKEFLDKLQQRVSEVEEEKASLARKVRNLESANSKLSTQVKRLQMALNSKQKLPSNPATTPTPNNTTNTNNIPAATTLLVLILSLALVVLPTTTKNNNNKAIAQSDNQFNLSQPYHQHHQKINVFGRSRTMISLEEQKTLKRANYLDENKEDEFFQRKVPRFSFHHQDNKQAFQKQQFKPNYIFEDKIYD